MNTERKNKTQEHRLLIAGFGGQGVLSLGKVLCNAAISEGLNATYMPSYGTEVRGGTCNCHIVLSQNEIFSPYVERADSLIILNQMSFDRFYQILVPTGILVYDSSMVDIESAKIENTQKTVSVPARDMAGEMGNEVVANVILLGAFLQTTQLCTPEGIESSIEDWLSPNKTNHIPLNLEAFHKGMSAVNEASSV